MKSNPLKPHQIAILAAGIASLVLWVVPMLHWVMLPLQYLNTHVHELCHALTAQFTGGQVHEIVVRADGSGVTPISGGSLFLEVAAGYVGAAIVGAAAMWIGRTERSARGTLLGLAGFLLFSLVVWVRGDGVGIASGIFWVAALWAISRFAKGPTLLFATQFIGLQQCLNAAQSLYTLLQISAFTEGQSDARIMQDQTGIPAMAWAIGWCVFSLAMVTLGLRKAWSSPEPRTSRPAG